MAGGADEVIDGDLYVKGLRVVVDGFVLGPLNFRVGRGSCLGVVGGNGSGKTLLVKALAGLISHEGEVALGGVKKDDVSRFEWFRRVGVVLDDYVGLRVASNVGDEVAFTLENLGLEPEKTAEMVLETLKLMKMEEMITYDVNTLSSGYAARLSLAAAMAHRPALLLLDNPLKHIDPPTRHEIVERLVEIKKRGTCMVVTATHAKDYSPLIDEVIHLGGGDGGPWDMRGAGRNAGGGEAVVEAEGVSFRYDGVEAVKNVSLVLRSGVVTALVGRNGAGKTTLGKILAGLIKPSRGRLRPGKVRAAFMSSNPETQLVGRTPREDIMVSLSKKGGDPGKAGEVVEEFGLAGVADKPLQSLGRGVKRLTALLSLYTLKPDLLVLDEPTQGLDSDLSSKAAKIITLQAAEGRAALIISHDIEFVKAVADRVLVMRDGEVVAETSPQQLDEGML
ncbi:MAG: ATP-binding cassette domain-containing protein [Nitrososphaerota archaeon]